MLTLRFDVDYPYPSRQKSFAYLLLGIKTSKNYLKNSKIIARMINESPEEVKAYWFFTPATIPDKELLELLNQEKHEVSLHIVNDPFSELKNLEKSTARTIQYYTIHGTERLLGRILWKRGLTQSKAVIPEEFPLKSFHELTTVSLDRLVYCYRMDQVLNSVKSVIEKGEILHAHPEWLFQKGTFNHRGPYYNAFKKILNVDKEFEHLSIRKKGFARIARFSEQHEYSEPFVPTERFLEKVKNQGVDVFSFIERKWSDQTLNPSSKWLKTEDNIALIKISTYDEWWNNIDKKTRNMVRKAQKSGLKVEVVEPSVKLAEGIWEIYNETPIRQGRAFVHYGESLDSVKGTVFNSEKCDFISASLENEVVGFVQLSYGNKIAVMTQLLSKQKHWDKSVNNALIAKAIETCSAKNVPWLMYGRMGNHPALDNFKLNNGFEKMIFRRYYVILSRKGWLATKLGIHREGKDRVPTSVKGILIPLFNWVSRLKVRRKIRT